MIKKLFLVTFTSIVSWLSLSYFFFPIKLVTTPDVYFAETMSHMMPLKLVITIIFALTILFIYEQRLKKAEETENN